jgi:hypothetical protein
MNLLLVRRRPLHITSIWQLTSKKLCLSQRNQNGNCNDRFRDHPSVRNVRIDNDTNAATPRKGQHQGLPLNKEHSEKDSLPYMGSAVILRPVRFRLIWYVQLVRITTKRFSERTIGGRQGSLLD